MEDNMAVVTKAFSKTSTVHNNTRSRNLKFRLRVLLWTVEVFENAFVTTAILSLLQSLLSSVSVPRWKNLKTIMWTKNKLYDFKFILLSVDVG